jgi:class 3 adenylate cyclase/tetratricopeptide (TPR) repeat protein
VQHASPKAYTPAHLAHKILTTRSALEGERKQVTVLFVDVVGSTALASHLDPEEVHGVMGRALELMLAEVHRYEGTVNQFLGDGIMALFGAPIAHEDHAQRALHAALGIVKALAPLNEELQRTRRLSLTVRQGLNTGLVVVGSIGDDLRMDYTAVGDTTNVAARLQQASTPGAILISEPTQRLVKGYFQLRSLGELSVKGKPEGIAAWEVLAANLAKARLDVQTERGLTPFVGRERELQILRESFAKAKGGSGQVVLLAGEAGLGKSRLLMEFRRRLGEEATWCEGRALSFGRTMAFHPLVDMLRRVYGIEQTDAEADIIDKIERAVVRLGEDLRPALPFLRYVLSIDPGKPSVVAMDPQLRRGEIFDALRRCLLRAAELKPQVIVYEDLHWMDQASEEFLRYLLDSVPATRVLLILTFRPEYAYPLGQRSYQTWLNLTPLSSEDSARMAEAVMAGQSAPNELRELIFRKAEGNPFFVEEVLKSLQEIGALRRDGARNVLDRPIHEIVVPDTIQDVLMARIDRLGEEPKRALQLAAVIGREFARRLIDRLAEIQERTDGVMSELKAMELITETSLFPELAYMFKHALTQEVTYGSLLVKRRKDLHRLIGLAIEDLYPDRLAENYAVLGYHFSRAEEWNKAFDYLLKAAQKAANSSANREAIALYDQAQEAAEHLDEAARTASVIGIHEAKGGLYILLSEPKRSRDELDQARHLAQKLGDRAREGRALAGMGFASVIAHEFDRAQEESTQAKAIADALNDNSVLVPAELSAGFLHEVLGRTDEARKSFAVVEELSRKSGDAFHESLALCSMALMDRWEGHYIAADRRSSHSVQVARDSNAPLGLIVNTWIAALGATEQGEYDKAFELYGESAALAQKIGEEFYYLRNLNSLGWLYLEVGDVKSALDFNRRAAEASRKRGDPEIIANAELNLADTLLSLGDWSAAQEVLDGVYRLVKNPSTSDWMKFRYSQHLFASLGESWLARGDPAKAVEFADQCLLLANRYNSPKYVARARRLKGEAALACGQWDEAQRLFNDTFAIAERLAYPTLLWKTHAALGRLHTTLRRPEEALKSFQAANIVLDQMKSKAQHPSLLSSFAISPYVAQIQNLIRAV